jgi:tetratricopeptide (TPR) repeat protein
MQSNKTAKDADQSPAIELTTVTRFNDPMEMKLVYENLPSEPADRSLKRFDKDFVFRYIMLMCLLDAPSSQSDKNDLIELFEKETLALPKEIEKFKETYSPSQAVLFYTRDVFIYRNLNTALRRKNIRHLLPFRIVLQNIYKQLHKQMEEETSDETLTLYRVQQSSEFEIVDLLVAYHQHSPVTITSFFSTSKDPKAAIDFLDCTRPENLTYVQILFIITAQKQDASHYFPFADISKISQHADEAEVLFVPGQMFDINNIEINFEKTVRIYTISMSMKNRFDESFTAVHEKFQTLLNVHMNDSLLCLAQLLVDHEQLDEAKELYNQFSENDDKNKKYACYEGLFTIANRQNDTNEAEMMHQKMTETKFGSERLTTNFSGLKVSQTDRDECSTGVNHMMNLNSQLSADRPLDELRAYANSDNYRNDLDQAARMAYKFGTMMVQQGIYPLAIQFLETGLRTMKAETGVPCDPLLKAKFCMQLGHCYRELKMNDTALENYKLAFEQSVRLPLDEYIRTLIGFGVVLEAMKNYQDALYKYIEVAEIYKDNSTIDGLDERRHIEECIRRVTSHLIPLD